MRCRVNGSGLNVELQKWRKHKERSDFYLYTFVGSKRDLKGFNRKPFIPYFMLLILGHKPDERSFEFIKTL